MRLRIFENTRLQTLSFEEAICISNELYSYSTLSAFQLAKGYLPSMSRMPRVLRAELLDARKTLSTKRTITLILSSKTLRDITLVPRDLGEVCMTYASSKRGTWVMLQVELV